MATLTTAHSVVRATLAAAAGRPRGLFPAAGPLHHATVHFSGQARFPGGAELMGRGRRCDILIRLTPADLGGIGTVCIKFPDLYGVGQDQDFLFLSSADGAPLHHVALPVRTDVPQLYSSLWLYLAGLSPVLFGVRAEGQSVASGSYLPGSGELTFLVSPPVGSFRTVGVITMGEEIVDCGKVRFAAYNCGGNLRALPPLRFYQDTEVSAAPK
jgi:hypothetical protein